MGKDDEKILNTKENRKRLQEVYPGYDDPDFFNEDEPINEVEDRKTLKNGHEKNWEEIEKRSQPDDDDPMPDDEFQAVCEELRDHSRRTLLGAGYTRFQVAKMVPGTLTEPGNFTDKDGQSLESADPDSFWTEKAPKLSDSQVRVLIDEGDDEAILGAFAQDPQRFKRLLKEKKAEETF